MLSSRNDGRIGFYSRTWTAVFILATLLLLAGGYGYYRGEAERIRQAKYHDIAAVGALKVDQIQRWRQEHLANARKVVNSPFLRRALEAWRLDPDNPGLQADWRKRLQLEQEAYDYANVLLLDLAGNLLLAAQEVNDPIHPVTQQAVATALANREVVLSDFYRAPNLSVYLDTVAPIVDAEGRPLAMFVLRSAAKSYLYPLIQSWPTPSYSAETLLVRREGEEVVFLNELRHQANTALSRRAPLTQSDLPAARAALGQQGQFQGHDYRNVDVLADLRPVPGSSWFLVTKVDTDEILAEARYRARMITLLVLMGILLAAAATAIVYRRRQIGLYRDLYLMGQRQREAQEEFRTTLYSIGDAVITTDPEGRIRQMNPVAEQLTGWPETEAQGQLLDDVFHIVNEETHAVVENPAQRVLREGTVVGLANHTLLIARDGTERPITDSGAPICDENGAMTGVVLVFRDQIEERATEQEIRRNEARLRSLASILQYPTDSVQDFLDYALNEAIQLTGSKIGYLYRYYEDRQEFVLNSWSREVMQECAIRNPQTCYELNKTGLWGEAVRQRGPILVNDFTAAHPLKKGYPEGHAELLKYLTVPVFSGGQIVGVVGVANKETDYHETDILQLTLLMEAVWKVVEQRQAQDKERQAVHSLRMLSHCNKVIALAEEALGLMQEICRILVTEGGWRLAWVGIAEGGPDKRVRPVAQAGIEEGYLETIKVTWDESPTGRGPAGTAIRTGQPVVCQNLLTDPHFAPWREMAIQRGYAAAVALPLRNETGVFGVFTLYAAEPDAVAPTEVDLLRRLADNLAYALRVLQMKAAGEQAVRKHEALEAQLHQAQKMEAIGRLAGGVAHDFNNMLAVIAGHTELALEQTTPDSALYADLLEIQNAAQRSADLTRQLLAFARKQTIAPKILDLNAIIAGMLKMLKRLIGEGIDLLWKPADDLTLVKMDPAQIDQILANLVVNARDAIAGIGKIIIETGQATFDETYCENRADCDPGAYVLLAVSDTGCGMDQAVLAKLFDPFFTTKPPGQGTGLGLATVYGIVKQNNGVIYVYSEPGEGTTFKIYLPRHTTERVNVSVASQPVIAPSGTETVLLVEDEEVLLKLSARMLDQMGYMVLAAGSPNQALQLAEGYADPIHLLLTDVIMPEMSGRDLWQRLSALRPDMKCLFMSGYTANLIAHHGVLDKDVHFLQKPFSREELATKLRKALSASEVAR
ncbi:MAG TPA: GAF domain-containing protein [Candidatus Competibacteraceae bacterium]|nr:GAF domain-containing protein [Candidatus Competibacteraceae bacterium]HRZ05921.1 GAF domain-containing protein [Candidatus Competibacteraceae bacterium]